MGAAGWAWSRPVLAALGQPAAQPNPRALRVWEDLPKWEEEAPPPPPGTQPVQPQDARTRLAAMLGPAAEQRRRARPTTPAPPPRPSPHAPPPAIP